MRLNDLVDNSQPESGSTLEAGLEGFENFFDLLWTHAWSRVRETNLPILSQSLDRDSEPAAGSAFHGADGILTEIPEHLLDLVSVGDGPSLADGKATLNRNARVFRGHAVIHE